MVHIWQDALEWTYYDEVLAGLTLAKKKPAQNTGKATTFQAFFCIDDRECSFRRYLEKIDPQCQTFATPGFYNVEFYFQPEDGKFYTKLCPWPVNPKHLIKAMGGQAKRELDVHFSKHSHSFYSGWLISQTLGFWSAVKLFVNIFRPSLSPATAYSFRHMDKHSKLTIENKNIDDRENNLQIGFTVEEIMPTCGTFATVGQRLASFLFYGTPARRVPALNLISRPFLALLQLTAAGLDELAGRRGDPLDHVLVARR